MLPFWDFENNEIPVEKAFPKSISPAHWVDPVCGHKWVQRIGALTTMFERMDKGLRSSVCPACEGNVLIPGKNDLGTTHPELATWWSEVNALPITEASKGSAKIVSWNCDKGHEWKSKVKDQVTRGKWCKKCDQKSIAKIPKRQSLLKDSNPDLYSQIVSVVGDKASPETLSTGSSLLVEWICPKKHIYEAKVSNRTSLGRNCPYCAGRYAIVGENDIATTNPEVMRYWDYEMNTLKPENVKKSTNKVLHWKCEKEHKWESVPHNLTDRKHYCPFCSGKKVIPGETDFASVYPEKLVLWNYAKNDVLPTEISSKNGKVIHWECSLGHEWQAPIYAIALVTTSTGCAVCAGMVVLEGFNDLLSRFPQIAAEWDYENNENPPNSYSYGSGYMAWWKCSKNHSWQTMVCHRTGREKTCCPECAWGATSSKAETMLAEYISELLPTEIVHRNKRKVVEGFEMDIYIPGKNFAIEYNGIYWHSEANGKGRAYHHDKWKACKDKGIQLIQIWEDEWNRNPEQIKRMLAHKLGISNERKVFARKTTVVELDKAQTELFLNENHVQGYASGSYYLGLKDKSNDEIVSVLVLKREAGTEGKTLNIIRYATNANVVGGFTKLLKHAEKQYQPESFITFSDHCVSDGGLYENNGFIADKELPPDYMYVVGNVRKHKFGYRINKFKTDPKLLWEEGLTERQLAELNGLKRIWDAGKTRWVISVGKMTHDYS